MEIHHSKRLDEPEKYPLIGQLTEVYSVIDDALDNGELSLKTLSHARYIGEEVLRRYQRNATEWQVYADVTDGTYSERYDMMAGDYPDSLPINIVGDVCDVTLYDIGAKDGAKVALVIESNTLGHHDRYTVPFATEGDGMIASQRPVDMPKYHREPYRKRLSELEVFMASDFNNYIGEEGVSEYELLQFFRGSINGASPEMVQEYFTAINLELEDAYDAGEGYYTTVNDATVEVLYDHTHPTAGAYIDTLNQGLWCDIVRVEQTVDEQGNLDGVSLIATSSDNSRLLRIPLDGITDLMLFRPSLNE